MVKELTPPEIAAILKCGSFDDLKGALENEHLECKAAPYQLQHDHQKYELAKDVSCIANRSARTGSDGGYVLLGVRTEKSPDYHRDIVVDLSPFDQGLVDPTICYQVLANWLLPVPEGIDIRWYPSAVNAARGIVGIWTPRQPSDRWPIILTRVVEDSGTVSGNWIAYFERRSEHAMPLLPADLQRLLRDGQRSDAVLQRFDALADQLRVPQEPQAVSPPPVGPSQAWQSYRSRRSRAVDAVGLNGVPVFALTAAPLETVSLPTLFRSLTDPLVQLLTHPPKLRPGGFDLPAGDPEIVEAQLRRAVFPGRMLLECWRDGTLIFVTEATDYLCWGMPVPARGVLRLNPMALVESTYVFATVAQRIYAEHATPKPETVEFGLTLYATEGGGKRALLTPHRLKSISTSLVIEAREAPAATHEIRVQAAAPWAPGLVAYQLLSELYAWFGFDEDAIPYVAEEGGTRVISKDEILKDG